MYLMSSVEVFCVGKFHFDSTVLTYYLNFCTNPRQNDQKEFPYLLFIFHYPCLASFGDINFLLSIIVIELHSIKPKLGVPMTIFSFFRV